MEQVTNRHDPLKPVCESSSATPNISAEQLTDTDTAFKLPNLNLVEDPDCECECDCEMEGCSEEVRYVRDEVTGKCICIGTGRIIITPCPDDLKTGETKGNRPKE